MEMKERDKLKIMLEKAEENLVKENQKTLLVMTIYYMVLCGIVMYMLKWSIGDIIIGAVFLGGFISWLTLIVYIIYTSLYTNKKALEETVARLKVEIYRIDRMDFTDDFIDED